MSNTGFQDSELGREQEFIDGLYARVDALRGDTEVSVTDALAQGNTSRQARLERDILVAERSGLLTALNAVDGALCFGRIDLTSGVSHHIGRIGLRTDDAERTPILIDWRADVARPFYLATGHTPMDLRRRRHITMEGRAVTALHDEILDLGDQRRTGYEDPSGDAVLLAALNSARTGRMGDIVQTIQAAQDRIIRAPHRGVLVVEGGPGTGKTAVALHRAAYLLYEHRELLAKRAVLIVGPNPAFLGYIGEVLPSLGETGVLLATVGELYPGVKATATDTPEAAAVKGRAGMADVLAAVVRDRQALPDPVIAIEQDRDVLMLDADLVRVARERTRETNLPHNVAREHFEGHILNTLTDMLAERIGTDPFDGTNLLDPSDITQIREELAENPEVWSAIDQLWPRVTPRRLIADFLAEPDAYVGEADAEAIRRPVTRAWTTADVPLLDEAAELLGVDDRLARAAAERERGQQVAYAQGVLEVSVRLAHVRVRGQGGQRPGWRRGPLRARHHRRRADGRAPRGGRPPQRRRTGRGRPHLGVRAHHRRRGAGTLADGVAAADAPQPDPVHDPRRRPRPDGRGGGRRFLVEASSAPTSRTAGSTPGSRSTTAHRPRSWTWRRPSRAPSTRTSNRRARSARRAYVPGCARPQTTSELPGTVEKAVAELMPAEGRLAVIAPRGLHTALAAHLDGITAGEEPDLTRTVVLLDPRQAKGLEFDAVLVVEPADYGTSDLYVALTRATQALGIVHSGRLPKALEEALEEAVDRAQD